MKKIIELELVDAALMSLNRALQDKISEQMEIQRQIDNVKWKAGFCLSKDCLNVVESKGNEFCKTCYERIKHGR